MNRSGEYVRNMTNEGIEKTPQLVGSENSDLLTQKCRRHISSLAERYHIEDISPVPQGTDIIEKSLFCQVDKRDFFVGKSD